MNAFNHFTIVRCSHLCLLENLKPMVPKKEITMSVYGIFLFSCK
ncbi:hypothetical protein APV28_2498 [Comamonas testosteroni]|nr:hypothetical protein APV28_2498 [Comamonas testosteroni]